MTAERLKIYRLSFKIHEAKRVRCERQSTAFADERGLPSNRSAISFDWCRADEKFVKLTRFFREKIGLLCNLRQKRHDLRQISHFQKFLCYNPDRNRSEGSDGNLTEKRYASDGCLIVSELSWCAFFERCESSRPCDGDDCFFCKFSDFRKQEYIEEVRSKGRKGVLYSVCHNEKNKKTTL